MGVPLRFWNAHRSRKDGSGACEDADLVCSSKGSFAFCIITQVLTRPEMNGD